MSHIDTTKFLHRTSETGSSVNFAFTAFSEVLVQGFGYAGPRTWTEDAPLGAAQGRVKYRVLG